MPMLGLSNITLLISIQHFEFQLNTGNGTFPYNFCVIFGIRYDFFLEFESVSMDHIICKHETLPSILLCRKFAQQFQQVARATALLLPCILHGVFASHSPNNAIYSQQNTKFFVNVKQLLKRAKKYNQFIQLPAFHTDFIIIFFLGSKLKHFRMLFEILNLAG